MDYRVLGKTRMQVSSIALGTVSLGVDYGIKAPGEFGCPDEADAIRLLQKAADAGISLFDTAPAYGNSEYLLGCALKPYPMCHISTKVSIPRGQDGEVIHGSQLRQSIQDSLENSIRALQRDVLDIVQIHNATVDVIAQGEIAEILMDARLEGKVRFIGASVYTEEEALLVIRTGCFDCLQVAYSILDQRMRYRVFPAAEQAGIGIITRSAFLKGALTEKAQWLPLELNELKRSAERVKDTLSLSWDTLPESALRFCLSNPQVASVLVGVRTSEELEDALAAADAGPLPEELLTRAVEVALADDRLLNPSRWPNV
ncbi:aldo/keto reductase [bacterium]|nr:aldo/keto reductase [bacterium]